ncbi:MAG: hypothetical protein H7Z17_06385 [Fuerstia sp.]|nr:hypothetical protein [Fuerstiella sp.]
MDYSIGLEAKAGVYRLQVNPDDEYVTLPIHAIADGILEDEKFLRLAIPGAKLPSPLSISIVDADRTGKALILVIANSRMGDRRLDSTKLTREVTSLQKLHGLKSSEQVIELVAGTVHIVDDTAESLYRSAKATPDLGRISPFAASFDDSTEPIEKAIRAWKNIAGYHPGIDVVFFVWLSDGKITRAPDQPVLNTFLKWDDRPKTDMHLIWLGGMTSTERFESKIAVPLEPLENAVIRLNDDSSSAAAIQKMIQKRHLKRVEQRDRDEATKHDARGGNNE